MAAILTTDIHTRINLYLAVNTCHFNKSKLQNAKNPLGPIEYMFHINNTLIHGYQPKAIWRVKQVNEDNIVPPTKLLVFGRIQYVTIYYNAATALYVVE